MPETIVIPDYRASDFIPTEIKEAAERIELFFRSQGMNDWEYMGLASRKTLDLLRADNESLIRSILEARSILTAYSSNVKWMVENHPIYFRFKNPDA